MGREMTDLVRVVELAFGICMAVGMDAVAGDVAVLVKGAVDVCGTVSLVSGDAKAACGVTGLANCTISVQSTGDLNEVMADSIGRVAIPASRAA